MARKSGRAGDSQDPEQPGILVGADDDDDQDDDPFGDLAFFSGAEDDVEWGVERYKTAEEVRQNPRGRNRVFVTKVEGKVDLVAFQREFGGGVFRFWGKRGNGEFYGAKKVELAGPRKSYEAEPPAAAPTPQGSPNGLTRGERLILKAMRDQYQVLSVIVTRAAQPGEKPSSITDLVKALGELDSLRGQASAPSDAGMAKELFSAMTGAFNQGIAIGQEREPATVETEERGTDWAKIFENAMALMERMSRRGPPRRVAPPPPGDPPGAAHAPPASSAEEVIEGPVMNAEAARWITAIDRLETLMPAADDAAEEIDVILTEQDLAGILPFPNTAVIDQIVARVRSDSPLTTPDGRAYLALVLDELRKPDSGD
jgi:hypothetical protein